MRDRFALLREPAVGVSSHARAALRGRLVAGMNLALARRIPLSLSGSYWLVPGAGYLCVVGQTSSTAGVGTVCARDALALAHGVAFTTFGAGEAGGAGRLIVGVAPDGARDVLIHTGGAVVTASAQDGVFVERDQQTDPPDYLSLR